MISGFPLLLSIDGSSWCIVDVKMTALFFLGTYDTVVVFLLNPKVDDPTLRLQFRRNSGGMSRLLHSIVSTGVIPLSSNSSESWTSLKKTHLKSHELPTILSKDHEATAGTASSSPPDAVDSLGPKEIGLPYLHSIL